jgi:hypothetical protein
MLRATKSRSRSSTVASLAAPVLTRPRSQVSVATVTAGVNSEADDELTTTCQHYQDGRRESRNISIQRDNIICGRLSNKHIVLHISNKITYIMWGSRQATDSWHTFLSNDLMDQLIRINQYKGQEVPHLSFQCICSRE